MANPKLLPKLLRPLPNSIINPKKRNLDHQNCHIFKKNHKAVILLQEEKRGDIFQLNRSRKYGKMPANTASPKLLPKLLQPLPKSILGPKKRNILHQNRNLLNKRNPKSELRLQEEKFKTEYIQISPENMEKTPANPKLLPKLLRLLPKSILDPKKRKLAQILSKKHNKKTSKNYQHYKKISFHQE